MKDAVSLASSLVKYFGPTFTKLRARQDEIRKQRLANLDEQVIRDQAVTEQLTRGQSLTTSAVDDLALANPSVRRILERSAANHAETDTIDRLTFVEEGKKLSEMLEGFGDAEIGQLREFFLRTLATEGPGILKRLSEPEADGVRQIIASVNHLASHVSGCENEKYLTPAAQEKLARLNPRELINAITPKK